jgi:beta-lactamase regulating signal transducer with metallopeptidase domain
MEANLMEHLISTGPAQALISSIWQGLLLTGFAWVALKLTPGLRASTRFTLWLIAFLLVGLLPFFALPLAEAAGFHAQAGAVDRSFHVNVAWAVAIEVFWAIASLFSLGRLLIAGLEMRRLRRASVPVAHEDLAPEIQELVARSNAGPIEIRLSDALDTPSVAGFLRPAVIMPRNLWAELETSELRQIIMHEKAHLDRGDDWTNLLQKLLRALCPLNPALLWAERHLCVEREQACDDAVLDAAGNPRAYATCLTKLAASRVAKRVAALAPGLWKRHSELAGRVENILHRKRGLRPALTRGLVTASLLASLAGAVMLQRCPRLITFAAPESLPVVAAASLQPPAIDAHEMQPKLQLASYHPASCTRTLPAPKPVAVKHRPAHKSTRPAAPRVQLIALRSLDESGALSFVVFTVEAPRSSTTHPILTTSNWIIFQI